MATDLTESPDYDDGGKAWLKYLASMTGAGAVAGVGWAAARYTRNKTEEVADNSEGAVTTYGSFN